MNTLKIILSVCLPVFMSTCKRVTVQRQNKRQEQKVRKHETRVTARETVTAKKDCSGITVLSETSDLSV